MVPLVQITTLKVKLGALAATMNSLLQHTYRWRGDQVTWISPSLAGLKVGVSSDATNDTTAMALNYSIGGTSVYFGSNEDNQNMGVKTSIAGFTVAAGARRTDGTSKRRLILLSNTLSKTVSLLLR